MRNVSEIQQPDSGRNAARRRSAKARRAARITRPDPQRSTQRALNPDEWTRANCSAASSRRPLERAFRPSKSRAVVNASSWTCLIATWRRSQRGHRGRQMTLEGIACLIAGSTTGSIALAVTSCNHTATRSRVTSKSQESEHVGRSARVVDRILMLHQVIHSQPQAAEDGRFELLRGCLQHAFQVCGAGR